MPERKRFSYLFSEAVNIFRRNISIFLLTCLYFAAFIGKRYIADRIIDTELLNDYLEF